MVPVLRSELAKWREKSGETAMIATLAYSSVIFLALVVGSVFFNRYIDRRPATRRADGETALWVAAGCTYALIGAGALAAIWSNHFDLPWEPIAVAIAATLAAFVAAGLPMALGDARRSQVWRETNEYLARAERANDSGRRRQEPPQ